MIHIHREGKYIIPISLLIISLIIGLGFWIQPYLGWGLLISGLVLMGFIINFFYHPSIDIPINDHHILSPCSGKVVVIEAIKDLQYFQDERMQVSIFMSPLNVHVNRNPITGKIIDYHYFPGKYLMAFNPKSSQLNEQNYIVVQNGRLTIALKQIAGFMARRIKCYIQAGDKVKQGEEFGFIRFGSRVDILLPLDAHIAVKLGDVVKVGQSVIATY